MPMRRAIFISSGKSKGSIASCTTAGKISSLRADSRVSKEHDNEENRNVELVSVTAEDWDSYN